MQLHLLLVRRFRGTGSGELPTDVLSINRFVTSFVIFFSLFFYGSVMEPFNHYLVWPRVVAMGILFTILFQIYWDRRTFLAAGGFFLCSALLFGSLIVIPAVRPIEGTGAGMLPVMVIVVGLIYAQSAAVQIHSIRRARSTGGLSYAMHLLFMVADVSVIAFALVIGWQSAWAVLVTGVMGVAVQIATLWHFRWVRGLTPRPA